MMPRASSKCGRERVFSEPEGNRPLLRQSRILQDEIALYLRNNMENMN